MTPPLLRKIVVVMPAYNAERTLAATLADIPAGRPVAVLGIVAFPGDPLSDEMLGAGRVRQRRCQCGTTAVVLLLVAKDLRQRHLGGLIVGPEFEYTLASAAAAPIAARSR